VINMLFFFIPRTHTVHPWFISNQGIPGGCELISSLSLRSDFG